MSAPSIITRIAPSPTGLFHLGTARTAYFNYLAAKSNNGKFILRIDDTDTIRNKQEYTDIIFQALDWLGLEPDEVQYQSKRTKLYIAEAKALQNRGKAIELDNGALALLCPYDLPKQFNDTISGAISITQTNRDQIDRKTILLRGENADNKDNKGLPTYQFASTVDDYFMGITWIIRGVDHITNTPKQIAIWQSLNEIYGQVNCPKELPKFTHLGLLMYNGKKLSKRDGAANLLDYREKGYKPEAMLDWMLRLGWAANTPRGQSSKQTDTLGYFTKERALEWFNNGKMKSSACNYDINKLDGAQKCFM